MLKENKTAFLNRDLEKYEYMERMFEVHKILYEYSEFINGTNISSITIENGEIYFHLLNNGIPIKMVCLPYDVTSVPFTVLDFGSYEPKEDKVLLGLVSKNDVALDIGANLGWYTIGWLKKNNQVRVYSFEPVAEIYNKLIQNLILNGQKIEGAFNFGLSNIDAEVNFFFDKERCGASSMVNLRGTENIDNVKCKVKTLDGFFPSLGADRLDFIKCDVEGSEKLVFEGGIETIKKHKPVIYSEMLRKWAKKFNYHPNDTIKLLSSIGYTCYGYVNGEAREIPFIDDDLETTNFLFFQKNKHKNVIKKFQKLF